MGPVPVIRWTVHAQVGRYLRSNRARKIPIIRDAQVPPYWCKVGGVRGAASGTAPKRRERGAAKQTGVSITAKCRASILDVV